VDFYLVRHGEALLETSDPRRPLSAVGEKQVAQMSRAALARKVRVSTIYHSGILRAQQTAEIFARSLLPPTGVQPMTGLLPQDDPTVARAELENAHEPVMLVGHLPHMSRLAALLINGDTDREAVEFSPATLACMAHEKATWQVAWVLSPDFLSGAVDRQKGMF